MRDTPSTSPDGRATDPSSRVVDEWECQQVVLRFTAHFDAAEHREMEKYFAPDGVWYQARGPIHGHEQLRERMAALPTDQVMRHVLTNLRTTLAGSDEAIVDSYFTVYLQKRPAGADASSSPVSTPGPRNIGRYRDVLRRREGRWLLFERRVMFDLKVDQTSPPSAPISR